MSGVDDRIVSMKFDNARFERNLNQTIKSLDKLRQSIDKAGSTRGFQKITQEANKVDFGNLTKAIEKLNTKLSTIDTAPLSDLTGVANNVTLENINKNVQGINEKLATVTGETLSDLTGTANKVDLKNVSDQAQGVKTKLGEVSGENISALTGVSNNVDLSNVEKGIQAINDKLAGVTTSVFTGLTNAANNVSFANVTNSIENVRQKLGGVSGDSLSNLTGEANRVDLSNIANGVQHISDKFNAMTVVATAAISRLTHMAVDAGVRIIKGFSFDPIKQGFEEFETNMNSIQTILANTDSKGSTLEDVNSALDQLNTYSDKTIYNFAEMARNIGTFTAAGVDLDTSVASIKGIANVAAISGSNSQQAATAMYQLSQAIAAGSVKLMDWNSVVNAGMGGEVFQKALFETGKKMKTLTDVPMSMTFEKWKDSGNSFRLSLEQGWLTGEVLTETLAGFTGDLTEAQILSMGYTKEQAAEIQRLGKLGLESATQVKTLTQLLGTIKESVASGWSASFRTIIGDFEESKTLFTDINRSIGDFVGRTSDARNAMLQTWSDFGGRQAVIEAFKNVLSAVGNVMEQVRKAFREFFPKTTAVDLIKLTGSFLAFTEKLKMGGETLLEIKNAFRGVFAVVTLGIEVVKGILSVFGDLFMSIAGEGAGFLNFASEGGKSLATFTKAVVASGKIPEFFDKVSAKIKEVVRFITNFIQALKETTTVQGVIAVVTGSFETLGAATKDVGDAWDRLKIRFDEIGATLGRVWDTLSGWFSELKDKIKEMFVPSDFDPVVDAVNVGLLGAIALMLRKFLKDGLKINFGDGVVDSIKESLTALTETLQAMQANLKAGALMKIAIAVGVLAGSMLLLSSLNSKELTETLTATTVAMGQLMTSLTLMGGMAGGPVKLNALASAMVLVATAVGILSLAIRNMSGMNWDELSKGLVATGTAMAILVGGTRLMSANSSGMISAGAGMTAMAVGLRIMAEAVEAFSNMEWESMAQGLIGVTGALIGVAATIRFIPAAQMLAAGAAMIPLSTGLRIMAETVEAFSNMEWESMAQGLVGLASTLGILALAMNAMPINLPITASGLLVLSGALYVMTQSVEKLGDMNWDELGRGLLGLAGMLTILVVAMNAMNGALLGAAALTVVAGALTILAKVLTELGQLSLTEIATGLGAIAAILLVIGGASAILAPVIPMMFALGVALSAVGVAFALFGRGAAEIARAFKLMAKTGEAGAKALVKVFEVMATAMPKVITAMLDSLQTMGEHFVSLLPFIVKSVERILSALLDLIIKLVPKIAKALASLISHVIKLVREQFPDLVAMAVEITDVLLNAFNDNISDFTELGIQIVIKFMDGITEKLPELATSATNLIVTFMEELSNHSGELVTAGFDLLINLLLGISNNISKVTTTVGVVIIRFLAEITNLMNKVVAAGLSLLVGLLKGITDNITKVTTAVGVIVLRFIGAMSENAVKIAASGTEALVKFISGMTDNIVKVTTAVGTLITRFIGAVGENATKVAKAGGDALVSFLGGISSNIEKVTEKAVAVALKFIEEVGSSTIDFTTGAFNLLTNFLNDLADVIDQRAPELRDAGVHLMTAIVNGMTFGLVDKLAGLVREIKRILGEAVKEALGDIPIVGRIVKSGKSSGSNKSTGKKPGLKPSPPPRRRPRRTIEDAIAAGHKPTRPTPVLTWSDLVNGADLRNIGIQFPVVPIVANQSATNADVIATTDQIARTTDPTANCDCAKEITFTQNNYSPTALSTHDIYRNTRGQIALAKEELNIA